MARSTETDKRKKRGTIQIAVAAIAIVTIVGGALLLIHSSAGMLLWAFWVYLFLAIMSLAGPLLFQFLYGDNETFFDWEYARRFTNIGEAERAKLDKFFKTEKYLLDSWRGVINYSRIIQFYQTFWSVVGAILLAALGPIASGAPSAGWIITLISLHLAITVGLHRAFKVERTLQDGLRLESDFFLLLYRFEHRPSSFGSSDKEQVDTFFKEYEQMRSMFYQSELSGIPEAHVSTPNDQPGNSP